MKTIAEDLVLIQTRETLKQFSVQSDADFFMIKELRMKVQSLQAELKNLNQMYMQSVRDREVLVARVQELRDEVAAKGVSQKDAKIKSLEKKNEEVMRDLRILNRTVRNYIATYSTDIKSNLLSLLKTLKNRYE